MWVMYLLSIPSPGPINICWIGFKVNTCSDSFCLSVSCCKPFATTCISRSDGEQGGSAFTRVAKLEAIVEWPS